MRRTYPNGEVVLDIHEAFCDDKGLVWAITEDPVSPRAIESDGETTEILKKSLDWMKQACDAPILDYDKIPEEGAKSPDWTNIDLGDETDSPLHTEESSGDNNAQESRTP